MHVLLFVAYAALLSFIITRTGFLVRSELSKKTLVALFLLSAVAGCIHVVIAYYFFPNHGDVWEMFRYSVNLRNLLTHNYAAFKTEFFPDPFSIDLAGTHLGWSYYQQSLLAAVQTLFNFVSFDDIYINVLLWSFVTLFGRIAFYRMLCQRYPQKRVNCLVIVFFVPSVVFWTSVIHKEALLLSCLGLLLYCIQKMVNGRIGFITVLAAVLALFVVFITRKAVFLVLMPAISVWWLNERLKIRIKYAVLLVCTGFVMILIFAGAMVPSWSLLYQLSWWQQGFSKLKGGSGIFVPTLSNDPASLIKTLPYAVLNGLVMPLPGFGGKMIYNLFSLEILSAIAVAVWSVATAKVRWDGFLSGFLLFAIAGCLIIGYTVPFAGAIVRYRSIYLPFLFAPFLLSIKMRHIVIRLSGQNKL